MPLPKHSILVVDDAVALRQIYAEVFRVAGFEVWEAGDGQEGLRLFREHRPELIFTGIMMPNMNGWDLMEKLRAAPDGRAVPVIISSHLGRDEDREKAKKLGAKAFVVKGKISPKDLVNLVLNILEERVWRVAVDPNKLDGPKFAAKQGGKDTIVLELIPKGDADEGVFEARLIRDTGPAGPDSPELRPDLAQILRDLESKTEE